MSNKGKHEAAEPREDEPEVLRITHKKLEECYY